MQSYFMLKHVLRMVTTGLYRLNKFLYELHKYNVYFPNLDTMFILAFIKLLAYSRTISVYFIPLNPISNYMFLLFQESVTIHLVVTGFV